MIHNWDRNHCSPLCATKQALSSSPIHQAKIGEYAAHELLCCGAQAAELYRRMYEQNPTRILFNRCGHHIKLGVCCCGIRCIVDCRESSSCHRTSHPKNHVKPSPKANRHFYIESRHKLRRHLQRSNCAPWRIQQRCSYQVDLGHTTDAANEAIATPSSRDTAMHHVVEGTRVDCLFDDDYFRGTVDAVYAEDNSPEETRLFRVCFDDGDVRDDVSQEDMELPLEPGARVECLFEVRRVCSWYRTHWLQHIITTTARVYE